MVAPHGLLDLGSRSSPGHAPRGGRSPSRTIEPYRSFERDPEYERAQPPPSRPATDRAVGRRQTRRAGRWRASCTRAGPPAGPRRAARSRGLRGSGQRTARRMIHAGEVPTGRATTLHGPARDPMPLTRSAA